MVSGLAGLASSHCCTAPGLVLSKMVLDASLLLAFNFKLSASICYDTSEWGCPTTINWP
jgi:hypothetical protein